MHLEKFQVDKIQNGRLSAIIHLDSLILWNIIKTAQDIYTITIKQIVRFQESPSSKWPPIGHYSLSHGRYLVNRARWLDHYYKTKCVISGEDAS